MLMGWHLDFRLATYVEAAKNVPEMECMHVRACVCACVHVCVSE